MNRRRCPLIRRAKFPSTFYQNTDKEKTVLWHAENFRRQFQAQFPRRRALVIAPKNECGTQKLFPTFINPCVLGYPEFLDALTCAEFFKEFFAPELMEHPTRVVSGQTNIFFWGESGENVNK